MSPSEVEADRRRCAGAVGRREHRGRPAAPHLHLLPSRRSPPDAQVALTLREVCGLTTEEIAQAFLSAAPTLAQRIVRAKAKIRDARIPYQVPAPDELPERLDSVLRVIYLVFNEGYSASSGAVADAASICPARRSASGGCSSSCCPSPRRWDCWR